MTSENISENIGKRIVDALKQQSELEIKNVVENSKEEEFVNEESFENIQESAPIIFEEPQTVSSEPEVLTFDNKTTESIPEDFEMPNNIMVLKQLIGKLPSGVSKQTGAQIIKQTMEAMGTSMRSVLQEAQQVQEDINIQTRECQTSIIEHKKQINELEKQSLKLQKQYSALNDIISLFIDV